MTLLTLCTGSLFREPETKISKGGKPYTVATLKTGDGENTTFVRLMAFGGVGDDLAAMKSGEALTIQGRLDLSIYEKDGSPKIGVSIVANSIFPLNAKKRKEKEEASQVKKDTRQSKKRGSWAGIADGPSDEIPF